MHSCSKLFTWKISKPAISRTPMNVALLEGRSSALLMRSTMAPKDFSYRVLPKDASSSSACCLVRACVTHSRPAIERSRRTALENSATGNPRRWPSLPATATRNVLGDLNDQNLFRYSQCAKLRRRCGTGRIARRDQNQPHQGPPTTRVVSKHVFLA